LPLQTIDDQERQLIVVAAQPAGRQRDARSDIGEIDVDIRPPDLADLIDHIRKPEALACPPRIDSDEHAQAWRPRRGDLTGRRGSARRRPGMENEREEGEHHREPPTRIFASIVTVSQHVWDEQRVRPVQRRGFVMWNVGCAGCIKTSACRHTSNHLNSSKPGGEFDRGGMAAG
jgi:hypothetical protein